MNITRVPSVSGKRVIGKHREQSERHIPVPHRPTKTEINFTVVDPEPSR